MVRGKGGSTRNWHGALDLVKIKSNEMFNKKHSGLKKPGERAGNPALFFLFDLLPSNG